MPGGLTRRLIDALARPGAVVLVSIGAAAVIAFTVAFAMTVGSPRADPAPLKPDLSGDAPSVVTAPVTAVMRDVTPLPHLRGGAPARAAAPAVTPVLTAAPTVTPVPTATWTPTPTPTATPLPVALQPPPKAAPAPSPTPQPTFDLSG